MAELFSNILERMFLVYLKLVLLENIIYVLLFMADYDAL